MASRYKMKKFETKSESWIDLSQIINDSLSPQPRPTAVGVAPATPATAQTQVPGKNSSLCSSYDRTRRSKSLQVDQQHLLIRLRQQSYLNRSSASLWSASNLSNSIDLNGSLADFYDEPPNETNLLKREPTRLRLLRDKFQRKSRKMCRDVREASPSARSLSSSIGDRLSDIRHSWKHFLYKYSSNNHSNEIDNSNHRDHNPADRRSSRRLDEEEDRLKMTDEWIARYHQQLLAEPSSRPRSVEISSIGLDHTAKDRVYFHHRQHDETRPDLSQTRGRSQPPPELTTTAPTIDRHFTTDFARHLTTTTNHRLSFEQHQQQQHEAASFNHQTAARGRQQIDSSSSTTLVSNTNNNNNNNRLVESPALTFISSSSAASTLSTQDNNNHRNQLGNSKPTSDYSPTTNSSQEESRARREQQVSNKMQQPPPHPKQPLPPVPLSAPPVAATTAIQPAAPLLLLHNQDQEYYLDVAQSQSQFQPPQPLNMMQAALFRPPQAAHLSFDQMTEYDEEDYAVPADESSYRLDRTQVELVQLIGEGQKGYVFLGKIQSKDGRQIHDVAIKTLKYETPQLIDWLMREAAMMRQLEHPHIIRFIGISTALSYLESKQFVHRDVAARNVLVCSQDCVKLADFGLTRNLQSASTELESEDPMLLAAGGGHYVAGTRGKLPVRWLAPESLAFRRFTSASDVWMFAVCGWEMFHYGQLRPWAHIRNNQVLMAIESGQRLARPTNCPGRLYELMLQCWSYAPVQRPKFRELKQNLWSIYLNERAREQLEIEHQQRILLQQQHQMQQQQARAKHLAAAAQTNRLQQQQQQRYTSLEDRLTTPRVSAAVKPWPQANLLALGVASPLNLSYGSNVSGYSSATAADFSSHNSSRSSSMGSLARRQQQQQQQQQFAAPGRQVWSPLEQQQQQPPTKKSPVMAGSATAALRNMKFESNVEQNMKRFQRTPGHMLQKQRSQGSIVQPPYQSDRLKSHLFCGYDDGALLTNHSASQMRYYNQHHPSRPLSHQSGLDFGLVQGAGDGGQDEEEEESEDDIDGDDEDYGADSSDEQLAKAAAARRHQRHKSKHRTLLDPARAVAGQQLYDEPTYEGLLASRRRAGDGQATSASPEVAMIRGDLSVIQQEKQRQRRRQERRSPSVGPSSDSMKREQKLSDVLQSLRLSPMKARLSGGNHSSSPSEARQSSLEPSQQHQLRHRSQHHHTHHHRQRQTSPSPKSPVESESTTQTDHTKERQLALHQRLLGHIKPATTAASSRSSDHHRRSMNMEKPNPSSVSDGDQQQQQQPQHQLQLQQVGGSSVEKVDQSLQILESLISENSFSPNQHQQQQQQQHQQQQQQQQQSSSADQLVHHHQQHLKQQLQQSDKRSNPAQQFVDFFVRRKQQQQQQQQ